MLMCVSALDQIITQIMENSSAHPVPASEEITAKLPREVLEENCKLYLRARRRNANSL